MIEDPSVRLTFATSRPEMPEFVQQQPEDIPLSRALDERQRTDRARQVEGVHEASLSDLPLVVGAEPDDLPAVQLESRPGEGGLRPGHEFANQPESEFKARRPGLMG
jgi:hypothetical protein